MSSIFNSDLKSYLNVYTALCEHQETQLHKESEDDGEG